MLKNCALSIIDNHNDSAKNNSPLLNFKQKIKSKTANGSRKDVETKTSYKYLSNFWGTLEMSLIECEIIFILTWSGTCVLSIDTKGTTFEISGTKIYLPFVTLLTHDNAKLLKQLKLGLKRTSNWITGQGDDCTTICLLD